MLIVALLASTASMMPAALAEETAAPPPGTAAPPTTAPPVATEPTAPAPPSATTTTTVAVTPAPAAPPPRVPARQVRRIKVTRDITFPIVFPSKYGSSFGYCRDNCTREHHGVDIFTYRWKGGPVVAAHSGIVEKAEVYGRQDFCSVYLRGFDGWQTRYVHLNTDHPATDDGDWTDGCLAPGIEVGAYVERGQILGWVGDSGNAEHTVPHIHFEIRTPRGLPVDPYRSLRYADRVRYTAIPLDVPEMAAVQLSEIVFPNGSSVVYVTSIDAGAEDGIGLPWHASLSGPVLLIGSDGLAEETRTEIARLGPMAIVVLDRSSPVSTPAQADLAALAQTVEHMPFPDAMSRTEAPIAGGLPRVLRVEDPPMRVVTVETTAGVSTEVSVATAELAEGIATLRYVSDERISRKRGRSVWSGPGRSGARGRVYYQEGDRWIRFARDEAPETAPELGIVIVAGNRELTEPTLNFLRSLAAVGIQPVWR